MMDRKKLDIAATTTIGANPGVTSMDRATWSEQADNLARNHARATMFQWAPVAALVILLAAGVALAAGVEFIPLAVGVLGALLLSAVIVSVISSQVYAAELRKGTRAIWRATWQREEEDQQDYNGDGVIGDPFSTVPVKREGAVVDEVIIPLPSNSMRGQPVMEGWGVTAADLVAFLFEAERERGLQERSWVGQSVETFVLPSGRGVTQTLFRSLQAALAEHGMASKPDGKWRLDVAALDVANDLKST